MAVELGRALGKRMLGYSSEDKREIIEAYELFGGNACKASKHLPYCTCTFLKYWRNAELETRKRGRPRKI